MNKKSEPFHLFSVALSVPTYAMPAAGHQPTRDSEFTALLDPADLAIDNPRQISRWLAYGNFSFR